MHTFIVSTVADPQRPGLTFKVELPRWSIEEWFVENRLIQNAEAVALVDKSANTTIIHVDEEGNLSSKNYQFEWRALHTVLGQADDIKDQNETRIGRPEKRVLIMNTSKDRRNGNLKLY